MKLMYNNDKDTATVGYEPTKTQQHFKDQVNINSIMKKYNRTGLVPVPQNQIAQYGDFTEVGDYHTALNKINDANNQFMELPSDIRKRFNNNPQEFLEFIQNEENRTEAIELGLIEKPIPDPDPPILEDKQTGEPAAAPDPT